MTKKNPNITTEAFKLNKDIPLDSEIRDFLDNSSNKSGLIKDALSMYMHMVKVKGYPSPYIKNNVGDWDTIFDNLNISTMIGRPAEEVKKEVINNNYQVQNNEELVMDDSIFDDEDDEDNDIF